MESLTELYPHQKEAQQKPTHSLKSSLLNNTEQTSTSSGKKAGDILLEHIDNLRCDKLRAFVEGNSDIDQLIQEYVFQVNSAIDLYQSFVDNAVMTSSENHNLQLARRRAQNGLKWLEDLR